MQSFALLWFKLACRLSDIKQLFSFILNVLLWNKKTFNLLCLIFQKKSNFTHKVHSIKMHVLLASPMKPIAHQDWLHASIEGLSTSLAAAAGEL